MNFFLVIENNYFRQHKADLKHTMHTGQVKQDQTQAAEYTQIIHTQAKMTQTKNLHQYQAVVLHAIDEPVHQGALRQKRKKEEYGWCIQSTMQSN